MSPENDLLELNWNANHPKQHRLDLDVQVRRPGNIHIHNHLLVVRVQKLDAVDRQRDPEVRKYPNPPTTPKNTP